MNKKHYNVVAGVVKRDGKVLCMQRGESRYEYTTLKWEFPGGKIEAGETPQDALKRELMEEMEYKVEPVERLVKVEHEYSDFCITLDVWLCRAESDEFEMKEHKDYRWLEPNELASLDFAEADKKAIKAIWDDN
ncbi:MAG: (deoxy)nucleoside triphosphate pyrophosphohydrolase [Muribaculaceae bacterium]|jgi:8-oxo-dGTP diphosphatase|nr:(deoxy)nucleoside triphosphate pyrophosphohydrolase [Muribaculaceae bacterium]